MGVVIISYKSEQTAAEWRNSAEGAAPVQGLGNTTFPQWVTNFGVRADIQHAWPMPQARGGGSPNPWTGAASCRRPSPLCSRLLTFIRNDHHSHAVCSLLLKWPTRDCDIETWKFEQKPWVLSVKLVLEMIFNLRRKTSK